MEAVSRLEGLPLLYTGAFRAQGSGGPPHSTLSSFSNHLPPLQPQAPGLSRQGQAESIAIKVYIRLIADDGLCRSELLVKDLDIILEQAPSLTAVSERGDAAGFGGGAWV